MVTERQSIQSLSNVAQIFDLYFSDIYNNDRLTEDILRVAGLVAFFQYINYGKSDILEEYVKPFGIGSNDFYDAINILNICPDHNIP